MRSPRITALSTRLRRGANSIEAVILLGLLGILVLIAIRIFR